MPEHWLGVEPTVTVEQVREQIARLTIVPYAEGGERPVRERNTGENGRVVHALRLDDVWQALDDLQTLAEKDAEIGR